MEAARQPEIAAPEEFSSVLEAQRAAFLTHPCPTLAERKSDLRKLGQMLRENETALVEAVSRDFGNRSDFETRSLELLGLYGGIRDTERRLKGWMKPQRRHADLMTYPMAQNRVVPQPLGVVGVIVPWNFPLFLSFSPLTSIFAAGNRAMVKMSENSAHLARLLVEIAPRYFSQDKLAFFEDGGGRGPAFSALPFDHLIFTGSTQTGRAVMASAAKNLCPVTLELGGKSPALVGADFPIDTAAERILWVKMANAGQICTNVDYLFLPKDKVEAFVAAAKKLIAARYPDLNGADYTSIIDQRSYQRLSDALQDAISKGATAVNLAPDQRLDASQRKFAPHLVLNPSEDMALMQREIFGPILPILTYDDPQEAVDYINRRDRPLALYPFTHDRALQNMLIERVMSGGVSINEGTLHVAQHDLPFGGVGASGMGHYHGREGFVTFSKLRPIFRQGPISAVQMFFQPPYGKLANGVLDMLLRLKR